VWQKWTLSLLGAFLHELLSVQGHPSCEATIGDPLRRATLSFAHSIPLLPVLAVVHQPRSDRHPRTLETRMPLRLHHPQAYQGRLHHLPPWPSVKVTHASTVSAPMVARTAEEVTSEPVWLPPAHHHGRPPPWTHRPPARLSLHAETSRTSRPLDHVT
jgi:hypothetical protein